MTNPTVPTTATPTLITPTTTMNPTVPTLPTTILTSQSTRPTPSPIITLPTTTMPTLTLTLPTLPTTDTQTTITQQQFCICVPIFQCAVNSGNVVTGVPNNIDPRQQLTSTCNGIFVCCNNIGSQTPATTLPPFTLPITLPTTTVSTMSMLPALNLQLNCLCVLSAACSLGYMPWSDVNKIDPRMLVPHQGQSCSKTNSVCCRLGQQELSVQPNSLVKFENEDVKNPGTPNACKCVPVDNCPDSDTISYDSDGTIDPRIGPCMSPVLVCCKVDSNKLLRSEVGVIDLNPSASIITGSTSSRANVANCGLRDTTYVNVVSPSPGSAYFAEFPWMVLILIRRAGINDVVQCGGSLINNRVVMTAAHCIISCDPGTLIARLGEWDTATVTEPLPFQEIGVQTVTVHPQFYQNGLYHDVALLVLNRAATYTVNVKPICLAVQDQQFAANTICYASGWGSNAFGAQGQYQSILRKVTLPIVDNGSCQTRLRATRLGQFFQLHSSFICAGGQPNMDTCTKDGGGPLVCQDPTGRFTQAGIVSWGIGCGSAAPGVYASVAQNRQWIDQQVSALGIYK
ncbi:phenoloxidase-activating factor 2-like [Phymastichus coffea]|uniref:phenoloxidase-activating factor 2-like n=1 Tax=Phymastichus coffea TaxID=108790 RepID=UPI00273BEBD5|nr:phenoloxidase-activating factor 2-like [Phymastichus coffea]